MDQVGGLFTFELTIQTIDIPRDYFNIDTIRALVTITDHLVQSIKLEFEASSDEIAYMDIITPIDKEFKPD